MHSEDNRSWHTIIATYFVMIALLQASIYIAVPKKRYQTYTGWRTDGPVGKERGYIESHYLFRAGDQFTLATEDDFLQSIESTDESPVWICVADILWYERTSVFDRLSLFSITDKKKEIVSFSAREGFGGNYTPIDEYVYSSMQRRIGAQADTPGFVQAGTVSLVLPVVNPLLFTLKLFIHAGLIWIAFSIAPAMGRTVRWWLLPTPTPNANRCINCRYSTVGLTSPICPECGKHHGTRYNQAA